MFFNYSHNNLNIHKAVQYYKHAKKNAFKLYFLIGGYPIHPPPQLLDTLLGQHYHPTFGLSRLKILTSPLTMTLRLVRKQDERITKKEVVYLLYCVGHVYL